MHLVIIVAAIFTVEGGNLPETAGGDFCALDSVECQAHCGTVVGGFCYERADATRNDLAMGPWQWRRRFLVIPRAINSVWL